MGGNKSELAGHRRPGQVDRSMPDETLPAPEISVDLRAHQAQGDAGPPCGAGGRRGRAEFGVIEVDAALPAGADRASLPEGREAVVAIEAARYFGSVEPQRDATGVDQLGAAEFEGAGDRDIDQPHLAFCPQTLGVEVLPDRHSVAVVRDRPLAVGRDLCTAQPNGPAYPGTGHGDGARGIEATSSGDAAVHDQVIR